MDCGMQNDKEGTSNRNAHKMTDRQETVKNWQGEWKKKQCLLVTHAHTKKQKTYMNITQIVFKH